MRRRPTDSPPVVASPKNRLRLPRAWFLATFTWIYVLWSLVPVLVAVQFSFNAGRSRSVWQGFSTRWYTGRTGSVLNDPALSTALTNTLVLAALTVVIATPLGVALALGLARWRGYGSGTANSLMLLPLATPEIVMGSALFIVFTSAYSAFVPLGRPAQVLGHVTFCVSYVVVIVRARLQSIGPEYEAAARDLGATPLQALRTVLMPLLTPAIVASSLIVFASSMDDFVISAFLSKDASTETVPIRLYSAVRAAPTPALNALATVLLVGSTLALILAWVVLRRRQSGGAALQEMASLDA